MIFLFCWYDWEFAWPQSWPQVAELAPEIAQSQVLSGASSILAASASAEHYFAWVFRPLMSTQHCHQTLPQYLEQESHGRLLLGVASNLGNGAAWSLGRLLETGAGPEVISVPSQKYLRPYLEHTPNHSFHALASIIKAEYSFVFVFNILHVVFCFESSCKLFLGESIAQKKLKPCE